MAVSYDAPLCDAVFRLLSLDVSARSTVVEMRETLKATLARDSLVVGENEMKSISELHQGGSDERAGQRNGW
ncbi:hypothetical protein IOCL2690_000041000 [Leishmania lindenbergi]|uniref:Uncharacterized protein n=1 Tax=Leishmania lindenbergi TaxID=651832 RepID=A0AAW3B144_9TRYP